MELKQVNYKSLQALNIVIVIIIVWHGISDHNLVPSEESGTKNRFYEMKNISWLTKLEFKVKIDLI